MQRNEENTAYIWVCCMLIMNDLDFKTSCTAASDEKESFLTI